MHCDTDRRLVHTRTIHTCIHTLYDVIHSTFFFFDTLFGNSPAGSYFILVGIHLFVISSAGAFRKRPACSDQVRFRVQGNRCGVCTCVCVVTPSVPDASLSIFLSVYCTALRDAWPYFSRGWLHLSIFVEDLLITRKEKSGQVNTTFYFVL